MSPVSTIYRSCVSVFVVLNLGTVLYMNSPLVLETLGNRVLDSQVPSSLTRVLRLSGWSVQRYAHLVGLDNRWQMFGRQSRFNWRYLISAEYDDSQEVLLPLPRQSPRSWWQDFLFDFREAKFMLNVYQNRDARKGWAYALCRDYPMNEGSPVRAIRFDLVVQEILPAAQARESGRHLSPQLRRGLLDKFPCPSPH